MDKFWLWLVRRLPDKLIYWACIHMAAYATSGEYSNQEVPSLTWDQMCKRWATRDALNRKGG